MNTIAAAAPATRRKTLATPGSAAATPKAAPPASVPSAPARKLPASMPPPKKQNRIIAHINVGWGNALYLRGDGGGLCWDLGVPMACLTDSQWVWTYPEDHAPREIKFLLNDTVWEAGPNHVILFQETSVYEPRFPSP